MIKILGESHPDQVVFFDPALSSQNVGDEIISSSAREWLSPLFETDFKMRVSTHQKMSFRYRRYLNDSKLMFVLGSNLLKSGMLIGFRQWDISLFDALQLNDVVLVGCGWHSYEKRVDAYSSLLYKTVLSDRYYHSVRDEYTKNKMEQIGITNGGCGGKVGPFPTLQVPGSDGTAPGSCSPDCS